MSTTFSPLSINNTTPELTFVLKGSYQKNGWMLTNVASETNGY